jgi:hypothetical protein
MYITQLVSTVGTKNWYLYHVFIADLSEKHGFEGIRSYFLVDTGLHAILLADSLGFKLNSSLKSPLSLETEDEYDADEEFDDEESLPSVVIVDRAQGEESTDEDQGIPDMQNVAKMLDQLIAASRTTWGSVTPSNYRLTPGYMAGISCRERTQQTQ